MSKLVQSSASAVLVMASGVTVGLAVNNPPEWLERIPLWGYALIAFAALTANELIQRGLSRRRSRTGGLGASGTTSPPPGDIPSGILFGAHESPPVGPFPTLPATLNLDAQAHPPVPPPPPPGPVPPVVFQPPPYQPQRPAEPADAPVPQPFSGGPGQPAGAPQQWSQSDDDWMADEEMTTGEVMGPGTPFGFPRSGEWLASTSLARPTAGSPSRFAAISTGVVAATTVVYLVVFALNRAGVDISVPLW